MLPKCLIFCFLGFASPVAAQAINASDCAQIRAAYGVTPSKCQTSQSPLFTNPLGQSLAGIGSHIDSVATISEPTQDMRQSNIFFTRSGSELDGTALVQIQRLAEFLNTPNMRKVCLKLTGHSDASGSGLINMEMGSKRANAVRNRLALFLSDPRRIEDVRSMGEDAPLPGLDPNSPWQRRVTLWARDCPGM